MANNIEWSLASIPPALADPDDLHAEEPLGEDEVAVWLGSDAAAVLYGTPDDLIEWANRLITLMVAQHVEAVCKEAGLGVMVQIYEIIRDREEVSDPQLAALTVEDVTAHYNGIVGPAVDQIEGELK